MNLKNNSWLVNAIQNPRVTIFVVIGLFLFLAPDQVAGIVNTVADTAAALKDSASTIDPESVPELDSSWVVKLGWISQVIGLTQTRQGNVSSDRMRVKLPSEKMKDL